MIHRKNTHFNNNDFTKTKYNPEVTIKEQMSKSSVFFSEIIIYQYQKNC